MTDFIGEKYELGRQLSLPQVGKIGMKGMLVFKYVNGTYGTTTVGAWKDENRFDFDSDSSYLQCSLSESGVQLVTFDKKIDGPRDLVSMSMWEVASNIGMKGFPIHVSLNYNEASALEKMWNDVVTFRFTATDFTFSRKSALPITMRVLGSKDMNDWKKYAEGNEGQEKFAEQMFCRLKLHSLDGIDSRDVERLVSCAGPFFHCLELPCRTAKDVQFLFRILSSSCAQRIKAVQLTNCQQLSPSGGLVLFKDLPSARQVKVIAFADVGTPEPNLIANVVRHQSICFLFNSWLPEAPFPPLLFSLDPIDQYPMNLFQLPQLTDRPKTTPLDKESVSFICPQFTDLHFRESFVVCCSRKVASACSEFLKEMTEGMNVREVWMLMADLLGLASFLQIGTLSRLVRSFICYERRLGRLAM